MKRVSLFAVLLIAAPALALAQTPPLPPLPPAPPQPVAAPMPMPAPVPPTPPVAPRVYMPASVDPITIADAMRAAEYAVAASQVDAMAIRDAVRASEQAVHYATATQLQGFNDLQWKMASDLQSSYVSTPGSSDYSSGLSLEIQRNYEQAIARFDRVINAKSPRSDAALYHKAWCQAKLGRTDEAVATLAILKKDYNQSLYLKDARALEQDVRKLGPNQVDDDDLKLLALQGIMNQNPELAIPALEGVIGKPTNSQQVRERALYVLATNDQPRAHQILLSYAKGGGNPDLQLKAIGYLANRGQKTSSQELIDIYGATSNTDVRLAVIRAFRSAGDKGNLMRIASGAGFGGTTTITSSSSNANATAAGGRGGRAGAGGIGAAASPGGRGANAGADLTPEQLGRLAEQRIAINGLTDLATPQELWPLYQKEENKDLRNEWVSTFAAMGALDQLMQVIKTEKEPSVRLRAVRNLGNVKSTTTGPALVEMLGSGDKDTRSAVIVALSNQNNAESLVAIARKETDNELTRQIVSSLANMAKNSPVAMSYLLEIIKK